MRILFFYLTLPVQHFFFSPGFTALTQSTTQAHAVFFLSSDTVSENLA